MKPPEKKENGFTYLHPAVRGMLEDRGFQL
jgi:hypothetical protein